ncbi:DUF1788 domain-containing protein [Maricaulaceae bacterium MS644]
MAIRTDDYEPHELLDHLKSVMSSRRFLRMESLNNEVPFFICPYPIERQREILQVYRLLVRQLKDNGINLLELSLYDLCLSILQDRGIWDQVIEAEAEISKAELKELLQGVLDPQEHLIPAIRHRIVETNPEVMLLTGVGEVFPFIRSHNVLNNLQSVAKDFPTVMFFPGRYEHALASGASLDLFGTLHDDKYYRAFNILHVEA